MITQLPNKSKPTSGQQTELADKQTRMKKCQQIAKLIQSKISDGISNGQVKVRSHPLHIHSNDYNNHIAENPEKSLRDKISSLSSDLQLLQKQIAEQKQQQRERQLHKRKEASLLIQRLKKGKEEHRSKLKINEMSNRLKYSALSEDVIKLMKERRDSLIQQKKKDMEQRILKNLNRRSEREETQANNQINYWSKIKEIQEKKRHHSTKILPSIHKINDDPQPLFGVNINRSEIKNSGRQNFLHKRSYSKQQLASDYQDIVNKFLERAKTKKNESKSQKSPGVKSRIITIANQAISQRNESHLANSKISVARNEKIQKIMASYAENKAKLIGNQYLKQSLLRVDKQKSPRGSILMDNSFAQDSLQLKGSPAIFSRSNKLTILQQRRGKILENLLNNKMDKSLAIEMLGPVESRLDKISPEGIELRLKQKLLIFEQIQLKQRQRQRQRQKQKQRKQEESDKYKLRPASQFDDSQNEV